jgi:hypothetical protein
MRRMRPMGQREVMRRKPRSNARRQEFSMAEKTLFSSPAGRGLLSRTGNQFLINVAQIGGDLLPESFSP